MLTSVAVPDVGCIKFHRINPSDNHDESTTGANERFPLSDIPVAFQLDDIQTNFATVSFKLFNVLLKALRNFKLFSHN